MSILENLPFSLCESGPEQVDGIGNFYLQVLAPAPSQLPLSTLYLLDSHGQIPSLIHNPDYDPINEARVRRTIMTTAFICLWLSYTSLFLSSGTTVLVYVTATGGNRLRALASIPVSTTLWSKKAYQH